MTPFERADAPATPPDLNAPFVSTPDLASTPGGTIADRRRRRGRRRNDSAAYSPAAVAIAAYLVLGVTTATSGAAWITAQIVELHPAAQAAAEAAGSSAVYVFAGTVMTLIVNAYVADRKSSRESAERIELARQYGLERDAKRDADGERRAIEATAAAARLVAEAKALADARAQQAQDRLDALEKTVAAAKLGIGGGGTAPDPADARWVGWMADRKRMLDLANAPPDHEG